MGDTAVANSGLSSVFQMMGVGDIGGMANVLKDLMSDKPVDQIQIPPGLQSQALQMVMQQFGASTVEEFLGNEQILERITNALQEDLATQPAEETIIFQFVAELNGDQLKELLVENKDLQELLQPMIEDSIQGAVAQQIESATLESVLRGASAPTEGLPDTLLGKKIDDLTAEDLTSLSDSQLTHIIPALPQETFQTTILDKLNANLPEDGQITAASGSYEDQLAAFNEATATVIDTKANGWNLSSLFNDEVDINTKIFDAIREEIPAALDKLKADFPSMAQDLATDQLPDYVTFTNGAYEIDFEKMPADDLKSLFDERAPQIAAMLKEEDNWPLIAHLITKDNLVKHQNEILPHILPEMTQEGLQGFRAMIDSLPPGLKGIITDFMDMAMGFLEKLGLNISAPAPEATSTPVAPADERAPDPLPAPGGQ